jgi:alkanesulfonate monooxygenase SsuD/methylene tetrahydromethanopterin reductase-like flavin-dependent oxidoreductase (luciferase family)
MGRGVAKSEYDAFVIEMDEAQTRFREIWDVIQKGLSGEKFTYEGEHIKVPKEVLIRPVLEESKRRNIHFYGAIGSPGTAERMADMGLPPMCTTIGDYDAQARTLRSWRDRARQSGVDSDFRFPIMVNAIIADSDEEAVEEAKIHMPPFMQAQVDHYESDKDNWRYLETYKAWSKIFEGLQDRCNPETHRDTRRTERGAAALAHPFLRRGDAGLRQAHHRRAQARLLSIGPSALAVPSLVRRLRWAAEPWREHRP